ncbi:MAG TPA: serine/threonine-protein kinase [Gemmatimonadales bacterium]|nr:serine/threonine-protein kinase [Gemmatimonadales bacterium]
MRDSQHQLSAALSERYRMGRELGRGGMAIVYLAQDLKHDRVVAIKVLRASVALELGAERFLREITTTAKLQHPHILPLYDSGAADGLLFYVMPYVDGGSLRERLDGERQLPIDTALLLAREVADALGYAHARGVIHRDIKPDNILFAGSHAMVADFGIARAISLAGTEKITASGVTLGTPTYMSPEQASGEIDLDGRTDLYSLACVLYEMLAGRPPFVGTSPADLVRQQIVATAPPVTAARPMVPPAVAAALGRALSKAPRDRFATMAEFATALSA